MMIRQYAIDPACIRSWDTFCRFMDQIGISHGRLIADLPARWPAELYRQLKASGLEEQDQNAWKRITERMARELFARKFIPREHATYRPEMPWIENAVTEHTRRPFDAIVAKCASPRSGIVDPADVTEEHPRWRVARTQTIPMTAKEIIGVIRPLLRVSREVLMIDPYLFCIDARAYRAALSWRHFATVRQLGAECKNRTMSVVEYHCGDCDGRLGPGDAAVQEFASNIRATFQSNLGFALCIWPKASLHNRMILTDVGGVIFGHGLDDCTGSYLKSDDVALLEEEHWQSRWNEYRRHATAKPSHVVQVIKRR